MLLQNDLYDGIKLILSLLTLFTPSFCGTAISPFITTDVTLSEWGGSTRSIEDSR